MLNTATRALSTEPAHRAPHWSLARRRAGDRSPQRPRLEPMSQYVSADHVTAEAWQTDHSPISCSCCRRVPRPPAPGVAAGVIRRDATPHVRSSGSSATRAASQSTIAADQRTSQISTSSTVTPLVSSPNSGGDLAGAVCPAMLVQVVREPVQRPGGGSHAGGLVPEGAGGAAGRAGGCGSGTRERPCTGRRRRPGDVLASQSSLARPIRRRSGIPARRLPGRPAAGPLPSPGGLASEGPADQHCDPAVASRHRAHHLAQHLVMLARRMRR
jgi:hypothetical protein